MFDYLRYRYACMAFFVVLLGASLWGYYNNLQKYGSGFNYSVDFTGGTQVLLKFGKETASNAIREVLNKAGYQGVELREFGDKEFLIRVQEFEGDSEGIGQRVRNSLKDALGDETIEIRQTNSVGSAVGNTLRWSSIKAIIIALLLMLLYVGIRFFSFAYSAGAVIALFHDALVIVAYFLLTYQEVSIDVIGAILTVLGYSVNDTIVIFSRIRENLAARSGDASVEQIVNASINQTMRRTILTSLSTALVVGALLLFGGAALRSLSITLLLGIVFGTYSSIFIASPVMLLFFKRNK